MFFFDCIIFFFLGFHSGVSTASEEALSNPTPERIYVLADALMKGEKVGNGREEAIHNNTMNNNTISTS